MQDLVDTHCHIQSIGLTQGERTTRELWAKAPQITDDGVVQAAADNGVTRLLCVGCDLEDSRLAINFAADRAGCFASAGIHPHEAQHFAGQASKLDEFAQLATQPKVVAIGECGLDFYYEHSPKEDQIQLLKFQIELAQKHNLGLIFHVREAFDDFWPIFDAYQGLKGVVHSFTDSVANLAKALERGLFIGVNGIATFTKDPAQLAVYREVPLEKLLLETDAPFLTPNPFRGNINEPKHVSVVADFLANLRGEDRLQLAKQTTTNAHQLFGM